jgi:hypothetical protein
VEGQGLTLQEEFVKIVHLQLEIIMGTRYATIEHMAPLIEAATPTERPHIVRLIKPLTVYKKVISRISWPDNRMTVIELELPVGTLICTSSLNKSSGYYGVKLRANQARVVKVFDKSAKAPFASYDQSFKYRVGELVKPRHPFSVGNEQCASGIHFYLTYQEARDH